MPALKYVDYAGVERQVVKDEARLGNLNEIPIVDIGAYLNPSATEDERRIVVENVRLACTEVGFLYIQGHGVPTETTKEALSACDRYFHAPESAKMESYFKKSRTLRGYAPAQGTTTTGALKESFNFGYEPAADPLNPSDDQAAYEAATPGAAHNLWPTSPDLTSFRTQIQAYYSQCVALGRALAEIFALALYLPSSYFDDAFKVPSCVMAANYYPPQSPNTPAEAGFLPHTDIECFTILLQSPDVLGLEILTTEGEWIKAPPIPGTFVINIGDSLSRWTNGQFRSTVHRVYNLTGEERYSIACHLGAAMETELKVIESCIPAGEKARFKTLTAGEYQTRRMAKFFLGLDYDESVPFEKVQALLQQSAEEATKGAA